ncbi:MAG: serine/threonine-protein kinase [Myxococcales bacterium]
MARICPDPACAKHYSDKVFFCGECGKITIQEQSPEDFDARLGERLGDYLVVARVADGAMGRVYEGRHHESKARVAVKVLHPDVARDAVAVERFKREYQTAAEMNHPNIVKVIEFGTTADGLNYLTMEYLEGEELGHVLRRDGKLETPRLIRVMCQAALAIDHAHSFGFIHRDLKPDNIFLCKGDGGDNVRVLDFGSVKLQMETGPKLTAFGTTLGSPYYMSPEQAMGKQDVDQRTDVFALTAIAYEAITGKIAFEAPNVAQILIKIINQSPTPISQLKPGLPPRLDDVIEKGLRKDKLKRYSDAASMAKDLCEAYGIEGNVQRWAQASEEDIARALETAQPPAAKAFGVVSEAPPAIGGGGPSSMRVQAAAAAGAAGMSASMPAAEFPAKYSMGTMIGVGVGALVLIIALAAFLFR